MSKINRELFADLKKRLRIYDADPAKHVVELDSRDSELVVALMLEHEAVFESSVGEEEIRRRMLNGECRMCHCGIRPHCAVTRLVEKSADEADRERLAELTRILSASLYWEK